MALWICKDCGAAYAVGLPACPQCGNAEHTTKDELERTLPKINRTGPSYESAPAEAEGTEETAAETETELEAPPSTKSAKADPAAPPAPPPAPSK